MILQHLTGALQMQIFTFFSVNDTLTSFSCRAKIVCWLFSLLHGQLGYFWPWAVTIIISHIYCTFPLPPFPATFHNFFFSPQQFGKMAGGHGEERGNGFSALQRGIYLWFCKPGKTRINIDFMTWKRWVLLSKASNPLSFVALLAVTMARASLFDGHRQLLPVWEIIGFCWRGLPTPLVCVRLTIW